MTYVVKDANSYEAKLDTSQRALGTPYSIAADRGTLTG